MIYKNLVQTTLYRDNDHRLRKRPRLVTGDKGIIAAAYDAAIYMACQWQAAHGHEPDPEAVRFEIVKGKDVL